MVVPLYLLCSSLIVLYLGFYLNHAGSTLLCKFYSLLGMVLHLQAS